MKKICRIRVAISLFLFICLAVPVFAQTGFGINDEDRAEFARHREALFEALGDNVAILFGAYGREDHLRWRQNNRFYYLTGVEIPYAALIMDGHNKSAILFLPPGSDSGGKASFRGDVLGPGAEAEAYFGIDKVEPIEEIAATLKSVVQGGDSLYINKQLEEIVASPGDAAAARRRRMSYQWAVGSTREDLIENWVLNTVGGSVEVLDLSPLIDELRRVKSPWELERIREACRIAGEAHVAAMQATKKGVMEYKIQAAAEERFIANGAFYEAFSAIASAGRNNLYLHYSESFDRAKRRDLILMDFGPDYRYYVADISRTWPVRGKFSERQRAVYREVIDVQQKLFEFIKPGVTLSDITNLSFQLLQEKGYIGEEIAHGPTHYVGMSVHDAGDWSKPLEPGVVLVLEPGLYMSKERFGVRIEDMVLVTKNGAEWLSADIPKDDKEVELIVQGKLDPYAGKKK